MLHPGLENGSSRLILQDTELARWTVGRVDLEASPPRVAVVVAVGANAVVTREETRERLAGRPETRRELTATWTLELSDQGETEWWLESSTDPSTTLQRLR